MLARIALLLMATSAVMATLASDESCKPYFDQFCDQPQGAKINNTFKPCSPLYGGVDTRAPQLRKYIKEHIGNSFEYLHQWATFNHYKKDREGFAKLYRKLSDDTWEDTIKLVKYMGKRGVKLDFKDLLSANPRTFQQYSQPVAGVSSDSEIASLARVLDLHKQLAISGNEIHEQAVKHDSNALGATVAHQHDIELAHFIEEEFAGKHAQVVRDLAGHSNDLKRLLKEAGDDVKPATGFYIHLFDEYLRKLY